MVDLLTPPRFDLLGPLPAGTTVLEASAGTGKTFTIAALVTRYVAEGVATMDQLLVVSFSREATRELRERVRDRLVSARDGFTDVARAHPGDEVLQHLLDVDPDERSCRRRRLEEALASFDSATVTTTHGFCQQVLTTLGTAGDSDAGAVLMENRTDLVHEVADDLYLRKWGLQGAEPPRLTLEEFRELVRAVTDDPATPLEPDPATPGEPGLYRRIADAARGELDVRKRRQRLIDYDDMLLRLHGTFIDPTTGPGSRARLRARYRVVLVDEFQDTDPVQWTILRTAFHGALTLVLIGDPKQAIYRFRGADVHAYLQAREIAQSASTLPVNWRSDSLLLQGLSAVFRGSALGDPRIRVVPVEAQHPGRMLPGIAPVRLRVVPRGDLPTVANGALVSVGAARELVVRDVAAEVVGLLTRAPQLQPREPYAPGAEPRDLRPGDIAVLTRRVSEARMVEDALRAAGVPVVLSSRASVFLTRAAQEWQLLLEAMEQPHRSTRVRRFAVGDLVGMRGEDLDGAGSAEVDELALRLRAWGRVLTERGVAALFEAVSLERQVLPRLLARPGGERLLTDLRHIGEGLHAAALEGQLGLTALLTWLRRRQREATEQEGQERSRRLESDAEAVQVITVHTSKGLEFPVVLVPFAWSQWSPPSPRTVVFHDAGDRRVRDVGGQHSPDWEQHAAAHRREELDDELRLTYVALTRAQAHLVMWWAPTSNTSSAPLHRLLMRDEGVDSAPTSIQVPTDEGALATFRTRAQASGGALAVELVGPRDLTSWTPPPQPVPTLEVARFERGLDLGWRRTSYSALTAAAHEQPRLGSEPEVVQTDDEADLPLAPAAQVGDPALLEVGSAWDQLPGGAGFGTLVHAALEELTETGDTAAVSAVVRAKCARLGPRVDAAMLTSALHTTLATPLGPLADGRTLAGFAAEDRLPELDFELPLAGGDQPRASEVLLTDLVPLWREHCPDGLLADYADALSHLGDETLRGYLTGSIDAVLRVGPRDEDRYLVVDYKTNRLAGREEPLTAWHYRPQALEKAMIDAHYPLQALLYSVALHRFLRWRVPGYAPETHLAGSLYLFLRGMPGPDVRADDGSVPGVFGWHPPAALVTGTSDLLAGLR